MLPIVGYPSVVNFGLSVSGDVFFEPQLRHFGEYVTGLMICQNRTVQGINDSLFARYDQSALNHFLTDSPWSKEELDRRGHEFVSDKLRAIKRALNRHLYQIARLVHGVPIACKRFGPRFNNNPVERRNQGVKRRYKVTHGFKSFRSARAFLRLCTVAYNFVHGTGESPAHRAQVWPGLGRNRLADLIALSAC